MNTTDTGEPVMTITVERKAQLLDLLMSSVALCLDAGALDEALIIDSPVRTVEELLESTQGDRPFNALGDALTKKEFRELILPHVGLALGLRWKLKISVEAEEAR